MKFKKSPLTTQDKKTRNNDKVIDYPTISDLMKEQGVSNNNTNTVHHRRDLDSFGKFKKY